MADLLPECVQVCVHAKLRHGRRSDDLDHGLLSVPLVLHQTAAGVWKREVSTGNAFSFSAGVKASGVLGIDLGITNNYSSTTNQKMILFYRPTKVAQICGDTDYPSRARKPRLSKYL